MKKHSQKLLCSRQKIHCSGQKYCRRGKSYIVGYAEAFDGYIASSYSDTTSFDSDVDTLDDYTVGSVDDEPIFCDTPIPFKCNFFTLDKDLLSFDADVMPFDKYDGAFEYWIVAKRKVVGVGINVLCIFG